jgi:hypothetical protein
MLHYELLGIAQRRIKEAMEIDAPGATPRA